MKKSNFSIPLSPELLNSWKRLPFDSETDLLSLVPSTWMLTVKQALTGLTAIKGNEWDLFLKGLLFKDELLMILNLTSTSSKQNLSYFFSLPGHYDSYIGLDELAMLNHPEQQNLKHVVEWMGDLMSEQLSSMEEILAGREQVDLVTHWQEEEYLERTFFIRNSKEDLLATLEAELLLSQFKI